VAKTRKLVVDVLADASRVTSEFGKIDKSTGKLGESFKKLGKTMALGMGAAVAGAVVLGKGAIDAAVEAQKVQKGLEASIRSSGGAANVTAAEIDKFASAMQFKTGIDDEAIKTSQTLLLGFRNVRNESGEGNKIFNRASVAMLDLGKKMGSTDAAAKALGKALSDPVGGLKGLKGAGVALTEQQKEQVKAFVKSGDLLSAQKIVLDEVTKATGGYAESTTTAGDRAKLAFGEIQEKIGGALLPIAEKLSSWFVNTLIPAVEKFWGTHGPKIKEIFEKIGNQVARVARLVGEKVPAAFRDLIDIVGDNKEAFAGLTAALSVLATAFLVMKVAAAFAAVKLALVNIQMFILAANPITLTLIAIVAAIAILVGVLVFLELKFGFVSKAIEVFGAAFKIALAFMIPTMNIIIGAVESMINAIIKGINLLIKALNLVKPGKDLAQFGEIKLPRMTQQVDIEENTRSTFQNDGVTRFAEGGIVTKPMVGMVGEAGPEAIIPLSRFNGGGSTINITINASPLSSPADVGSAVVDALKAYERRNGSLPLKVA
jgi:hypothetical protein